MGKVPAYLLLLVILAFYIIGYGQVYKVLSEIVVAEPDIFSSLAGILAQYSPIILTAFSLITVLSVLSIIFLINILKKHGDKILLAGIFIITGITLVIGIILLLIAPLIGVLMLLLPIVMIFIIIFRRERIRLAGMFLKMSSDTIWREKQILLISVVFGVFMILTSIAELGVLHLVWGYLNYGTIIDLIILFVAFLASAWISYSALYLAEGAVVQITHDWYRNPKKDVAKLSRGFSVALERSGPVLKLSLVMAIMTALSRALNVQSGRERNAGSAVTLVIGAIVAAIARGIIEFVTYFTLPAIIIEKMGFKDGVKRSAHLVWRYMIDVILGNSGVGMALMLIAIPVLLLFGGVGFIFGGLLVPADTFTGGIAAGIVFLIAGALPLFVSFKFLYAVYKTILYEYALDEETNFKNPSMLPNEIAGAFRDVARKGGKRKMKQPNF